MRPRVSVLDGNGGGGFWKECTELFRTGAAEPFHVRGGKVSN